jgi:arginine deiminase
MEMHLDTFLKMKDRERVAAYLEEYLHSGAYLGYTDLKPADTLKITQLFRRLYKTPD